MPETELGQHGAGERLPVLTGQGRVEPKGLLAQEIILPAAERHGPALLHQTAQALVAARFRGGHFCPRLGSQQPGVETAPVNHVVEQRAVTPANIDRFENQDIGAVAHQAVLVRGQRQVDHTRVERT